MLSPFLIVVMELLPLAIRLVERWMDEDVPNSAKRGVVIEKLMKDKGCSENHARCAVEIAVDKVKNNG